MDSERVARYMRQTIARDEHKDKDGKLTKRFIAPEDGAYDGATSFKLWTKARNRMKDRVKRQTKLQPEICDN